MTLLVLKVNQLGDNVVFLPVVQSLAAAHPDWRIVIATSPLAAPLYRVTCPAVEVLEFETRDFNDAWRRPWRLPQMALQLRKVAPTVCLVANDQSNVAHLLARLSGAALCIGPGIADRKLGFMLHQREPMLDEDSPAMQNWRIAQAMLRRLGEPSLPEIMPAPDLRAFGCTPHGSILIHPGASRPYQRWPLERYVTLANRLCQTHPVLWIIQGDVAEGKLDPLVSCIKPTSLTDFMRLTAGARLFVGNNSGPLHLASALGVPGVILTGPSAYVWDPVWHRESYDLLREPVLPCQPCDQPGRPAHGCSNLTHPMACLDRWSVEQVHRQISRRLALA